MSKTLIATSQGFYDGQRIRAGQEFAFEGKKVPAWATENRHEATAKISAAKKRADQGADTRAIATQQASKKKVEHAAKANPGADENASIA